jgi:endonuclease/exonuclease/phosphatase family metal-dependent hydrolase
MEKDVHVALLQEVTHNFDSIRGYTAMVNEGTEKRGKTILTKDGLSTANVKRLPSGRGMAALFMDTWLINVYAPSGADRRNERETFFNKDITYPLPTSETNVILAGDFNCVVKPTDCTGRPNVSRALSTLTKGLGFHDVWDTSSGRIGYTHYTHAGASRIDRIYTREAIMKRKQGAETIARAFTDHLAVTVCVKYDVPSITRKYWTWRMNHVLLGEIDFREKLMEQWSRRRKAKCFYPNSLQWWDRYVKRMIKRTFQREGAERKR